MKELPLKIVVVNTGRDYAGNGHYDTGYVPKPDWPKEGPWYFNYTKTFHYPPKFLVAVDHSYSDSIEGCYNVIGVYKVTVNDVKFTLTPCGQEDDALVRDLVKGMDLTGCSHKMLYPKKGE